MIEGKCRAGQLVFEVTAVIDVKSYLALRVAPDDSFQVGCVALEGEEGGEVGVGEEGRRRGNLEGKNPLVQVSAFLCGGEGQSERAMVAAGRQKRR